MMDAHPYPLSRFLTSADFKLNFQITRHQHPLWLEMECWRCDSCDRYVSQSDFQPKGMLMKGDLEIKLEIGTRKGTWIGGRDGHPS